MLKFKIRKENGNLNDTEIETLVKTLEEMKTPMETQPSADALDDSNYIRNSFEKNESIIMCPLEQLDESKI